MTQTPIPPVPQDLRDMLNDYPELIDRLQESLKYVAGRPPSATPLFERAVWILEDALDAFAVEARAELRAAEQNGDPGAIAQAKRKRVAVGSARADMGGLSGLRAYFNSRSQR